MKNLGLVLCLSLLVMFGVRLSYGQSTEAWPSYVLGSGGGGYELFSGKKEKELLGRKLSNLGDIDGDGVSEWGLATLSDGAHSGGVYIISGTSWPFYQEGGALLGGGEIPSDIASIGILSRLIRPKNNGEKGFGFSMTSLGDMNKDGYGDIAIGVPFAASGSKEEAGKQVIIFGSKNFFADKADIILDSDLRNVNISTFVINGANSGDNFGISVEAGDVDGDGFVDVAVGAYRWGGDERGATYVLWGGKDFSSFERTSVDINSLLLSGKVSALKGLSEGERLGWSLHIGGDMNRDGSEELVIGSPGFDSGRGRVYVVSGKGRFQNGASLETLSTSTGVLIFDGVAAYGESGWTVGGGEDVNGDGFSDALIGTRNVTGVEGWEPGGSVATLFGGSALKGRYMVADIGRSVPGYILSGRLLGEDGFEVEMLKDLNGDGFGDYAIGIASSGDLEGRVVLVYGGSDLGKGQHELGKVLAGEETLRGLLIVPPLYAKGDDVVVSSGGDINQDGHSDILISLPLTNVESLENAGKVYVLFGSPMAVTAGYKGTIGSDNVDRLSIENPDRAAIIYGYGGDDYIEVSNDLFQKIDGGRDKDTLVFAGTSLYLGSQAADKVSNVEVLDLRKETTKLHLEGVPALGKELEILSDGDDKIILEDFEALVPKGDLLQYRSRSSSLLVTVNGATSESVVLINKGGIERAESLQEVGIHEGLLLRGGHNNMRLGHSFSGIGDVNGDGVADFAVGAVYANADNGKKKRSGRVYILYGGSLQSLRGTIDVGESLESSAGSLIDGGAEKDRLGWSVGGSFDVNDDGYDDLVIGTPHGSAGDGKGRVYVVFGGRGGIADIDLSAIDSNNTNVLEIVGEEVGDYTGWSVSSVGDMNGDGIAEIVIGVPHANGKRDSQNNGRVLVLYGSKKLHNLGVIDASKIGFGVSGSRLDGQFEGGRLGWSVAGVGDMNGDGLSDIALGAPGGGDFLRIQEGKSKKSGGRVYMLGGRKGGSLSLRNSYMLKNDKEGENLGFSVSGGKDVNGDSLSDALIGSPRGGYGGGDEGFVILLQGNKNLFSKGKIEDVRKAGATEIIGDLPGSRFGHSVSLVGDMNGDGLSELLIGAPRYFSKDYGLSGAGYVIKGRKSWDNRYESTEKLKVTRYDGGTKDEQLGLSTSSLGDVSGDGKDDFVFGSYYADSHKFNNSGIGYILYGPLYN